MSARQTLAEVRGRALVHPVEKELLAKHKRTKTQHLPPNMAPSSQVSFAHAALASAIIPRVAEVNMFSLDN